MRAESEVEGQEAAAAAAYVAALGHLEALRRAVQRAEAACEEAALDWARAEDARSAALDARARALGSAQASDLAATLVRGAPCPVCGSKFHPAPAGEEASFEESALELAIADARADAADRHRRESLAALEKLRAELDGADRTCAEAQSRHAAAHDRLLAWATAEETGPPA